MQGIKNLVMVGILAIAVGACIKQPEYSVIPQIDISNLYFKPGSLSQGIQDTLVIGVHFKDGDGDLGIGAVDTTSDSFKTPWYYIYDSKGTDPAIYYSTSNSPSQLSGSYTFIDFKVRKQSFGDLKIPDTLNCSSWQTVVKNGQVYDTLFITQNLGAFNFFVDLYTSTTAQGPYVKYDPATDPQFPFPNKCNVNFLRGAFPDLSNDRKISPIDGVLTYRINSFGLNIGFSGKYLKLNIYITDRAGHQSNVITTDAFTLAKITK